MKKLFLLLILLSTTVAVKAQHFYESSDVTVELKYWNTEADVDYLVQNGIPVTYSWVNNGAYRGISATYLHQDKFIALWFQDDNIQLCGYTNSYSLSSLNEALGFLNYMPWYSGIRYDKIVYDTWWNRILIPVGTDSNTGGSYAISIYLYPSDNRVITMPNTPNSDMQYYNLQGVKVDPEKAKGQILIKTNGVKSEKILNK